MPTEHMQTAVVAGTGQRVRTSRAVWMISDFGVAEMSAAFAASVATSGMAAPLGIAQEWTRNAPGTPFDTSMEAGNSGDEIMVYTNGAIALARCGGTIAAGAPVTATTDATIVEASGVGQLAQNALSVPAGGMWILGYAKEAGAQHDIIRMEVRISLLL